VLGEGDAADAKRRLVLRAGGVVYTGMAQGMEEHARLAFVAYEDRETAQRYAQALRNAGVLVNVVDQPDLCDFTVPSILDRAPVLVAVGTGGASAGLAKALRLRLEQMLPQALGPLAMALGAARDAMRARFPDMGDRRRALDLALAAGGVLDPMQADADAVAGWLANPAAGAATGVVEVTLRSADPEDLTLREARLLGSADLICHEPGVGERILVRARADAMRRAIAEGAPVTPHPGALCIVLRT
jgi:uroporphyrin-III C-methyltransferase/precorrin-2 dehydrogenase/sirohydrochlorin ferrochelatase